MIFSNLKTASPIVHNAVTGWNNLLDEKGNLSSEIIVYYLGGYFTITRFVKI
jgi:hypothetical protein